MLVKICLNKRGGNSQLADRPSPRSFFLQVINVCSVKQGGIWLSGYVLREVRVNCFFAMIASVRWVFDKLRQKERVKFPDMQFRAEGGGRVDRRSGFRFRLQGGSGKQGNCLAPGRVHCRLEQEGAVNAA